MNHHWAGSCDLCRNYTYVMRYGFVKESGDEFDLVMCADCAYKIGVTIPLG